MSHRLRVSQSAGVELVRPKKNLIVPPSGIDLSGRFNVELWRKGKRIDARSFPNGITIEGKNRLLDVAFHAQTQITTWYIALIDLTGYSALDETDIYDDINQAGNGWDEFDDYTDPANADSTTTRPVWTEGAAASKSITNASPVVFDITATGTVKGIFIVGGTNAQTKGDHTAGTANALWSTALFTGGDVAVENLDQLKITYTISS
jgi:hypothetical protein